ncbi:cytochrome c maturation protein CcmE [Caballeronia telluris]|uniref:Cytochrome c-type biogenesis protein CcmE n=1 Tax=Caballeronia telluris TaxID=326475 RepID=A0A158K2Z5_9BURK|nr:cytochrome c maturation protein CcmE [Caballeronia telluris]SAL75498.1 Cytochrome c-type biogenesis protein CcmE [Caballeronia telluris]
MKPRTRRFLWVALGVAALGMATTLVLNAFRANVMFFASPTQVAEERLAAGARLRIGGLVGQGSLARDAADREGLTVRFIVTDTAHDIRVTYRGVLPDLFREGKGVVAEGTLMADGTFVADQVLAKHDENYLPPPVAGSPERASRSRPALRVSDHSSTDPAR